MRYDPTDYLYASARIRAMENRLIGRQKLNQLLEMSSIEEIRGALAEGGAETALETEEGLKSAFAAVAESVPDKALLLFLQYPYDCHNLKVLEKCRAKGIAPTDLLIDLGSIPVKALLTVSENELFSLLPPHMAAGLTEARDTFAKTANPQEIDFILDRAAYADMAAAAAPFPLAAEWVRTKIDLTNLLMCLRLLRMQNGALGRAILNRAMLHEGSLDESFLLDCYDGGETAFFEALSRTPYGDIFAKEEGLAALEKRIDDHLMALTRRTRSVTFGAEVPIAYLLAAESQSKNLRILLAGKAIGQDSDTIKTRMRESYV